MIAHFIILQKDFLIIHCLRVILCLACFAEVDQVQSTFIDMATFKNVTTLTESLLMKPL